MIKWKYLFFLALLGSIPSFAENNPPKIIIIAGPGEPAFDSKQVTKLKTSLEGVWGEGSVIVVGDGDRAVSADEVQSILKSTKDHSPLILNWTHGETKGDGAFYVKLGDMVKADTIFNQANQKSDVFLASCESGSCLYSESSKKSKGNWVAAAPSTESATGVDFDRFIAALADTHSKSKPGVTPTSIDLLRVYLALALKNRIRPQALIDGKTIDLDSLMKSFIGRKFTADEKSRIISFLDDLLPRERIDEIIQKIENSKNEWGIYAVDYGPALAAALAASDKNIFSKITLKTGPTAQTPEASKSSNTEPPVPPNKEHIKPERPNGIPWSFPQGF